MTTLILHGPPPSSYVRTARTLCEEKGITYELHPVDIGSDAHRELHPWAQVPILTPGTVRIYETAAICRYLDDVFPGRSFTPMAPAARASMEQWISALNCYFYEDLTRNYGLQYLFPRGANGEPNRAVIDPAVERMHRDLDALERGLAGKAWLAGDAISIA